MGFFDKLLGKDTAANDGIEARAAALTVCAPFTGAAMKLEDIPDPVFSQGILGPGCGMDPAEETVYAPFDGTVTQTTDTKHALGVTSADGVEVLIHVGMDTVEMGGKGFPCMVKEGDKIKAGQPMLKFTLADIQAAGHPAVTAIVVTNADDFAGVELVAEGTVEHGAPLLKLKK